MVVFGPQESPEGKKKRKREKQNEETKQKLLESQDQGRDPNVPNKVALGGTGPAEETEEEFKARAIREERTAPLPLGFIRDARGNIFNVGTKQEGINTAAAIAQKQQLASSVENQLFKESDVAELQTEVAAEQGTIPESEIQKFQKMRGFDVNINAETWRQTQELARKFGISEEEAAQMYALIPIEDKIKLTAHRRLEAGFEDTLGEIGQDFIGVSMNELIDNLKDRQSVEAITGTLSEMASYLPAVEGMVNNGAINPQRALAKLKDAQKDIRIMDDNIQRAALLSPQIVHNSEYLEMRQELRVLQADLIDATGTALEKLRTTQPQFNVLETQEYVSQIEKQIGTKKK